MTWESRLGVVVGGGDVTLQILLNCKDGDREGLGGEGGGWGGFARQGC